jgi:hypothetical protein
MKIPGRIISYAPLPATEHNTRAYQKHKSG